MLIPAAMLCIREDPHASGNAQLFQTPPTGLVPLGICGMVMTERGQVLNRTSIFPLSVEDLNNPAIEDRKSTFTGILEAKLKDKAPKPQSR